MVFLLAQHGKTTHGGGYSSRSPISFVSSIVSKAGVTRNRHPIMLAKSAISCSFLSFSTTSRNEILVSEDDSLGSLLQVFRSKI